MVIGQIWSTNRNATFNTFIPWNAFALIIGILAVVIDTGEDIGKQGGCHEKRLGVLEGFLFTSSVIKIGVFDTEFIISYTD